MLRILGRRLTLLNVIISGGIMLMMALVALSVAESMMASQYEKDLWQYSSSMLSTIYAANDTGIEMRIQVPGKYYIYFEDENQQAKLLIDNPADSQTIQNIIQSARESSGAQLDTYFHIDPNQLSTQQLILKKSSVLITKQMPIEKQTQKGLPSLSIGKEKVRYAAIGKSEKLDKIAGDQYRISASMIEMGGNPSFLLVLQDRTEELATRNRLRFIFFGCIMGGLFFLVLASLYLSSRAIKPVENAIQQQREFVAAASHELRTPVAAIRANAEVLSDAQLGEFTPYLHAISSEGERMTRLIVGLLDLARADAGELPMAKTLIDVQEVAHEIIELTRPLADSYDLRIVDSLITAHIVADNDRLRQVLVALLDNAIQYTQPGGEICVSITHTGQTVGIHVADTGIGIADEHKERIFDRFYRIDTARSRNGGAGLGLSIAKQLVEQMNGIIKVMDREGRGSVFTIEFKAAEY